MNLLETQIGLVEANEGIAIIAWFSMMACHNRQVNVSELIEPIVHLELYQDQQSWKETSGRGEGVQCFPRILRQGREPILAHA